MTTKGPLRPIDVFRNHREIIISRTGIDSFLQHLADQFRTADPESGIARKLQENSEWHMELLDETKEPVFRIRIVAETLD